MNGHVVTILFLHNTFFSYVELIGHGFTPVSECPKTQSEVMEASKRLQCGNDTYGNNQYICLRDVKFSLIEFCYDGEMGIVNKGNCLELSEGMLKNHSCHYFSYGCPEIKFWFHEFYRYPACQNIYTGHNCYTSNRNCQTPAYALASSFSFFSIVLVIGICSLVFICSAVGFIKAKRYLNSGKGSVQNSSDLFSMEAGVNTTSQFEPSIPPPAPPPPPSNT